METMVLIGLGLQLAIALLLWRLLRLAERYLWVTSLQVGCVAQLLALGDPRKVTRLGELWSEAEKGAPRGISFGDMTQYLERLRRG